MLQRSSRRSTSERRSSYDFKKSKDVQKANLIPIYLIITAIALIIFYYYHSTIVMSIKKSSLSFILGFVIQQYRFIFPHNLTREQLGIQKFIAIITISSI